VYKRLVTIALAALSMPALGLAAFGAAHSVSASPASQVIIPAISRASSTGIGTPGSHDAAEVRGADDRANHDVNHASGDNPSTGAASATTLRQSDDATATTTTIDDHGGIVRTTANPAPSASGSGSDDGSRHRGSDG
jgi:hypothetical protein